MKHSSVCLLYVLFVVVLFPLNLPGAELKGNAQITYTDMRGNVNSRTAKLDGEIKYLQETSTQKIYGGLNYVETDEVKTAGSWYAGFKNMSDLSAIFYLQEKVELRADEFQGYNYLLSFDGGPGAVFKSESNELRVELGPGFIYEDRDDESKGYPSSRGFMKYTYKYNERISGSSYLEHIRDLSDLNNFKTNWNTYGLIKLTDILSLKTGREFRYVHMPPEGIRKHDWTTYMTLVMDF